MWFSQAVAAVLGVLALGNEYGTRMITVTMAAVPGRQRVLATKAGAVLVLVPAVPSVVAAVAVARGIFTHNGFTLPEAVTAVSLGAAGGTMVVVSASRSVAISSRPG